MRRSPLEEGRRWLDQAKEDLHWARELARLGGTISPAFWPNRNTVPDSIPARVYTEGAAREAVWTCPDGRPGRFGPRVGR
jgi:hypothetical protein